MARSLKNDLQGRPTNLPGWAPYTSDGVTHDLIVREYSRIAFDDRTKDETRLKALDKLAQHAGMFIERKDVRHLDMTKAAALSQAFDDVPTEAIEQWLNDLEIKDPTLPVQLEAANPPTTNPDADSEPNLIPVPHPSSKKRLKASLPDFFTDRTDRRSLE